MIKKLLHWGAFVVIFRQMFAYLDPGSGSLIVQAIIAIIVGILATLAFWKNRILSLLGIKPKSKSPEEYDEADYE